jgi:transcriptional regulator with XRE-family HTH domain
MSNGFDRLRQLVGVHARIADALGLSREQVSRISTGRSPVPEYMEAVAELLEALPPKDWPERWRK